MIKTILDYQKSYNKIIEDLKLKDKVLAIFVYGSMITGDLWEGSNIDLIVVYDEDFKVLRDSYLEINEVPIHLKLINKNIFNKAINEYGRKNALKTTLLSSKIIYCIDKEVSELYERNLYIMEEDKDLWGLVYLGDIIKDIGICKKYIKNSGLYAAYEGALKVVNNISNIILTVNSYRVSKDPISMACHLDENLDEKFRNLLYDKNKEEKIKEIIEYSEDYINTNLDLITKEVLIFLKNNKSKYSSFELKNNEKFENYKIRMEDILSLLNEKGIILKDYRDLKDKNKKSIIKEKVYYI